MAMKTPKVEVWEAKPGDWHWHLKSRNGEIQAQGEGHPTRHKALRAVESVRRNMAAAVIKVLL
jgi:uncharacterized protein YegP (UPF0339 family)